jgi:hypothetical protein
MYLKVSDKFLVVCSDTVYDHGIILVQPHSKLLIIFHEKLMEEIFGNQFLQSVCNSIGRKDFGGWKDVPASRTKPTGGQYEFLSPGVKHTSSKDK